MCWKLRGVTGVLSCVVLAASIGSASEDRIRKEDLPAAVQATVDRESKDAIVRSYCRKSSNGKTFYRIRMTVGALEKNLLIDSTGTVVEMEQELPRFKLPENVAAGLESLAGKRRMFRFRSITRNKRLLAYEADATEPEGISTLRVAPDGTPLAKETH